MKSFLAFRRLSMAGIRIFIGLLFLYASVDKILYPGAFAEVVYNYRILPDEMIHFTAVVLPWLELLLGLFLIFDLWLPGAVLLANALFMVFFASMAFNMARGLDIECGCFPQDGASASLVYYLVRDGFFLFLSILAGFLLLSGTIAWQKKPNAVK